jgi:hypothetical protein
MNLPPLNINAKSEASSPFDNNSYSFGSGWTVNIDEGKGSGVSLMGSGSSVTPWLLMGALALVAFYLVKK